MLYSVYVMLIYQVLMYHLIVYMLLMVHVNLSFHALSKRIATLPSVCTLLNVVVRICNAYVSSFHVPFDIYTLPIVHVTLSICAPPSLYTMLNVVARICSVMYQCCMHYLTFMYYQVFMFCQVAIRI